MNKIIIGETCLLDKQLRLHGVISEPHGCFDNVLVNLDIINSIIDSDFSDILNFNHLQYINYPYYEKHGIYHQKWINVKHSQDKDDIYSWDVFSLFHTHSEEDFKTLDRRVNRTKEKFEDHSPVILFYYYRQHEKYDVNKHHQKLINFLEKVCVKYGKPFKCLNFNNFIGGEMVEYTKLNDEILSVTITSPNSWVDIDDNWDAHTDNSTFSYIFNDENVVKFLTN